MEEGEDLFIIFCVRCLTFFAILRNETSTKGKGMDADDADTKE